VVAVNKADGDLLLRATSAAGDYRHALRMLPPATPGWTTPVLTYSARDGTGLTELWKAVIDHRELLHTTGQLAQRRAHQQKRWLERLLEETILRQFRAQPGFAAALADAQAEVTAGAVTVPQAVRALMERLEPLSGGAARL